ncbi:MAG TPA: flagellar basal body rod protein FlgC [Rhodospirillaceae bacterium]|jgi:flagellar basal-body rod protein FlgC|nr:flagellar basal body rod protein FlgC [Rhodospirillaceae bacterium]MAX62099.1 flagellar basal body rod protein FlgC [Rhodospirillaceae bacterium]MBB58069.1 flagellar basal body rod protein FlgC [Rhodospirillaceae bacterium]HAE00055.1 flagellar basal body rod protein FlgC [Rhodospirillaceae bacterium]HAJ19814.1 flagellar basal body rod protein FlgC [Rhodospirillaceae bacterium]|tara:strand:+ start:370 stop:780 length:411 start_codon:yes stop_codon:yes gene_type:complete
MDDFNASMFIAGSGMRAQGMRLRVISENIANADSTASTPGGDPYRRKVITFKNKMDEALGADVVQVKQIGEDNSDFDLKFDPAHPAANEDGYVLLPNVSTLVESMDMREANRSYQANLRVVETAKGMFAQTVSILR